jgi:L-rhamnose isomerase
LKAASDFTARLAMLEELKTLPFGEVWDYYCSKMEVPAGADWLEEVRDYEAKVTTLRQS